MRFKTLDAWLRWLETCHPREIDLGLERIREVAGRLDLLDPEARVLTVAGTNGKGSCAAASAYLLGRAGFKAGVFSSPHFLHYCERICVDGQPVTEAEVCRAFAAIDAARGSISLTYFEFGALAALDIFRQRGVDILVLEVGLGGRLDAVNILDADVSVVTSIDLDHQDWLGSDRDAIGREKAGIFRSHRPALCADPTPPKGLLDYARATAVPLHQIGTDFGFATNDTQWRWWGGEDQALAFDDLPLPALPLPSLAAALQAVALLGVKLQAEWLAGLCRLNLPGRFQRFEYEGREFILDVAHNPAATAYLARRLDAPSARGRTLALVAMMRDKDRRSILAAVKDQIASWWLADLSPIGRAVSVEQLENDVRSLGGKVGGCGTVGTCIERLLAQTDEGDRIVIMGSFYTVAAALQWFAGPRQAGEAL